MGLKGVKMDRFNLDLIKKYQKLAEDQIKLEIVMLVIMFLVLINLIVMTLLVWR